MPHSILQIVYILYCSCLQIMYIDLYSYVLKISKMEEIKIQFSTETKNKKQKQQQQTPTNKQASKQKTTTTNSKGYVHIIYCSFVDV